MAAGVTKKIWEMSDMVAVLEEWEATQQSRMSEEERYAAAWKRKKDAALSALE